MSIIKCYIFVAVIALIIIYCKSASNDCDYCENIELVPSLPNGSKIQDVSMSLDIDTVSFQSSDIYRIDYTIRSRWVVGGVYCRFYLNFLKNHGYFSENDENTDHEDVRLTITEDVYRKFIWTPDTTCLSAREEDEPSTTDSKLSVVTLESDKDKRWPNQTICKMELLRKVYSVSVCAMNLRTYPVDTQQCSIKFGSFMLDESEVVYKWVTKTSDRQPITIHNETKLSQYETSKIVTTASVRRVFEAAFTTLTCDFTLDRYILSTLIGMYIPSGLIAALSWLSLWISPLTPPARANLLVTSLLALLTQFTASRAGTTTSEITSLDIWFLVCFVYVFAALIQFAVVKTITTHFDDEQKLIDEDNEFQEKHHSKDKVGEIAKIWKTKIQSENDLNSDKNLVWSEQVKRRESVPFMNVPAASRLRSTDNIESSYKYSTDPKTEENRRDNYYSVRTNSLDRYTSSGGNYNSDSESSYSSGLRTVSITDSVFNSPVSSHFYYSPDIVMQKPWMVDEPIASIEHIYQEPTSLRAQTVLSLYGYPRINKSRLKLPYLSPVAPDYVKRQFSILSHPVTLSSQYSSALSSGPSSFHTSKWNYEVGNFQNRNVPYRVAQQQHSRSYHDVRSTGYLVKNFPAIQHSTKLRKTRVHSTDVMDAMPNKKVLKKVEEKIHRKELVKKVEKWSRILFPLTFIFFNLFYWPYIYNR